MVFLGLCFCGFGGVVVVAFLRFRDFVEVFLWMCFCGGAVVFLFAVVFLRFRGCVCV